MLKNEPSMLSRAMHAVDAQAAEYKDALTESEFAEWERAKNSVEAVYGKVDALLVDRSKVHGDWVKQATLTSAIKHAMGTGSSNIAELPKWQLEALAMIAVKISRILTGDPNHKDHWDDISGYARLVSQQLEKA